MENNIRALIEKLKKAVEHRTKVDFATALVFSEANAHALVSADARVESASAMLMAMMRSAVREKGGA